MNSKVSFEDQELITLVYLFLRTLKALKIGMDLLDITVPETIARSQITPVGSPKWLPEQPFPSYQPGVVC